MKRKIINDILIDAYSLSEGGGKRYLLEIIKNFDYSKINNLHILLRKKDSSFQVFKNNKKINFHIITSSGLGLFNKIIFKIFIIRYFYFKFKCNFLFVPDGYSFFFPTKTILVNQNILPFEDNEMKKLNLKMKIKMNLLYHLFKYSIKVSKNVIFLSNFSKNLILKKTKLQNISYKIINHGVEPIKFTKLKKVNKNSKYKILYVSSFYTYKNHIYLLSVFNRLCNNYSNIELIFVGNHNEYLKKTIIPKIKNYKNIFLNNNLFIKNFIPMNKIFKIYQDSNLFVFPSTCENFPNILIEALSSGRPVLSSNYGPMKEIIKERSFLFSTNSETELYNKIKNYIDNKNNIVEKNTQYCISLSKKYNWINTSKMTLDFILK